MRGLHNLRPFEQGCVLTIGNFDGVHLGHQAILNRLNEIAAQRHLPALAMVFEPQPKEFFAGADAPARLTSLAEKLSLLQRYGVQQVACMAFNQRLRQLSAAEFVEHVLVRGLNCKALIVGDDFRFGCDRSGDFAFLKAAGESYGFSVEDTCTVQAGSERISSTRVRAELEAAHFDHAAGLLGRPYSISGKVAHGQKLGRTLGVPTANVLLKRNKVPFTGVYAVEVDINGSLHQGVANIGMRPTVNGTKAVLESHIFAFNGDLYGKRISVIFRKKIREEQKFNGLDALKAAIENDIKISKAFFGTNGSDQPL